MHQNEGFMVRSPGFEPGSSTWQADVLNQARLRPRAWTFSMVIQQGDVDTPLCWLEASPTSLNQHGGYLFKFSEKASAILVHNVVETVFLEKLLFASICSEQQQPS